jgi:hypothetical protein
MRQWWRENGNALDRHLGGGDIRGVICHAAHNITCFQGFRCPALFGAKRTIPERREKMLGSATCTDFRSCRGAPRDRLSGVSEHWALSPDSGLAPLCQLR